MVYSRHDHTLAANAADDHVLIRLLYDSMDYCTKQRVEPLSGLIEIWIKDILL